MQGDLDRGLDLYSWNTTLSAAMTITIGNVEVVLRNAIHDNLSAWSAKKFGEARWYLDPGRILQRRALDDIEAARQRVARRGYREQPGRVIAELTLDLALHSRKTI